MVFKLNKPNKAFTLAETMIVLLILSIISAAFLPVMTKRLISKKTTVSGIWTLTGGGVGPDIFFKDGIDGGGASSEAGAVIGANSFATGDRSKLMINTSDAQQYHLTFQQGGNTLGRLTMDDKGNLGFGNVLFDQVLPTAPIISNATAIGAGATASGTNSTAFGSGAQATKDSATALGSGAIASNSYATNVGSGIAITGPSGNTSIGISSSVSNSSNTAIGQGATASNGGTAVGKGANAGSYSVAVGTSSQATTGNDSVAIGAGTVASSSNAVQIGHFMGRQATNGQLVVDGDLYLGGDLKATGVIYYGGGVGALSRGNNSGACPATCLYYTSDRRLKNVHGEFNEGLNKINELHAYNYTYKKDKKKTPEVGVMAQDLQKVLPNAVTKDKGGDLMIRQEDMFYSLLNSIKQLDIITQGLVKEIKALSARAQRVFDKIVILTKNDQLNSQKIKRLETKNALIKIRLKKLEKELNV